LLKMKSSGAQRFLAQRYGVSEGQMSKIMREFESAGLITRKRDGQSKVIAIAPPKRKVIAVFRHKSRNQAT